PGAGRAAARGSGRSRPLGCTFVSCTPSPHEESDRPFLSEIREAITLGLKRRPEVKTMRVDIDVALDAREHLHRLHPVTDEFALHIREVFVRWDVLCARDGDVEPPTAVMLTDVDDHEAPVAVQERPLAFEHRVYRLLKPPPQCPEISNPFVSAAL